MWMDFECMKVKWKSNASFDADLNLGEQLSFPILQKVALKFRYHLL